MRSRGAIRSMVSFLLIVMSMGGGRAGAVSDDVKGFRVVEDAETGRYTITEDGKPVLTYNFKNIPVPDNVSGKYAVARSDYIHPLYGPGGEALTKDYPPDHPHHRGIYWAWPEVTWKGETKDLHALQGVFARPVRMVRNEAKDGRAVLEAENVWKWEDRDSIVSEFATITVYRAMDGKRVLDFDFRFQALVDGVTLARRGKSAYGGLNLRLSARTGQKIVKHRDPAGTPVRQAWACLAGVPSEADQIVSLVILQNMANPEYPGEWVDYPELNWLQPTFPSNGLAYELKMNSPLVLRYRLVVSDGNVDEQVARDLWAEYNKQTVDGE